MVKEAIISILFYSNFNFIEIKNQFKMLNSSLTGSLRSLNEVNAKPKRYPTNYSLTINLIRILKHCLILLRTSYGNMSTWFFMDNVDRGSDLDKSYMNVGSLLTTYKLIPVSIYLVLKAKRI